MGTMELSPGILNFEGYVNVFDLWGMDAPTLNEEFNCELDRELEWAEDNGKDYDELCELFNSLNWDMNLFTKTWAESVCETIENELIPFDEHESIVRFGDCTEPQFCDQAGFGRSYTKVWLKVDGARLYEFYRESFESDDIPDGHGVSGFVRTCSDSQWAVSYVVSKCIEHLGYEMFMPEQVEVTDYLHGKDLEKFNNAVV